MMQRKTSITLLILGGMALFLVFFVINPIYGQIKKESENFIVQKKELIELEAKGKNIHNFRSNFKQYQPNLEKIDNLFVNTSEPIEFIEFLEKEAADFQLSIEITPPVNFAFSLKLEGPFLNFSRFFERLESSPYLIAPTNLSIRKISDKDNAISAVLLIKAHTK